MCPAATLLGILLYERLKGDVACGRSASTSSYPRPANKSKNTIRRISAIFRFDMLVCNISRVNNTQREHFVRGDGLHRRNKIDNNGACEGTHKLPCQLKANFYIQTAPTQSSCQFNNLCNLQWIAQHVRPSRVHSTNLMYCGSGKYISPVLPGVQWGKPFQWFSNTTYSYVVLTPPALRTLVHSTTYWARAQGGRVTCIATGLPVE